MLLAGGGRFGGGLLAHPLTQPFELPVSPLTAAWAAVAVLLAVAFAVPQGGRPGPAAGTLSSWEGTLSRAQIATRVLAVALLALAVAAGRLGADDQLDNPAPALVVGAAWPLLVLAAVAVGPVWRWLDPWDGLARALARGPGPEPGGDVRPAALLALPWVWYLSAYGGTLEPRPVGTLLALYSLVSVAGCLAVGRRRWLASCEPLGILLSWLALVPRGRLTGWQPPRGAQALLGVLAGGVLFGAARRSELWGGLNTAGHALVLATAGAVLSAALAALVLVAAARWASAFGARPAVVAGAVPALAAIVLAVALDRNRLTTSVQLLPELLGDPFGRGWDPFLRAGGGIDPAPLGVRGLLGLQLGLLFAGHAAGAAVAARLLPRGDRWPSALALSALLAASVVALATP